MKALYWGGRGGGRQFSPKNHGKIIVKVVLEVPLEVLEVVLVVLDLSWSSWPFTEASEVWVRVDWMPLIVILVIPGPFMRRCFGLKQG